MKRIIADYIADIKLIQRNIYLFVGGCLLIGLLQAAMSLLMNLYLKDIGYGEAFIGRTLSINSLGAVVAGLPAAYLAARYKIKPILLISTVLVAAAFYLMGHADTEWLILSGAFFFGFFTSVRGVISAPFIMRNTGETERMLVFTMNYSTWMVAAIIGSYLGGWLHDLFYELYRATAAAVALEQAAYQGAMTIMTFIGLLSLIPFFFIKAKAPAPGEAAKAFSWPMLKGNGVLLFKLNLPFLLLGTGAGLIIPFLNLYFRNRFHLDTVQIGVYFSILSVVMLIAVALVPILKRKLGFIRTVVMTEIASIPFMMILCFTDSVNLAFWAFLFRGALMNMGSPASTGFMMEAVPPELHGIINSLSATAWTVSWAITAPIGGASIERSGFVPVFLWAIALYIASAASYYYFFGRVESRQEGKWKLDISRMR